MKFLPFLLLIISLITSCYRQETMKKDELLANQISLQTTDILEKRYGLRFCGAGGSYDFNKKKTKTLKLCFQLFRVIDKNACRKMIVDCIEEFVDAINKNDEIKQYLSDTPFTVNNVEIVVYIYNSNHGNVYDPDICIVDSTEGVIRFYTKDPEGKQKPYKSITEESFAEALAIVNNDGKD